MEKFTEEQYLEIIKQADNYFPVTILHSIWQSLSDNNNKELIDFVRKNNLYNELTAITNPLTREWAHDNFVEKEKKYVWSSKKNVNGYVKRIYKTNTGMIRDYVITNKETIDESSDELLTESEIKLWGYDSSAFYRKKQ